MTALPTQMDGWLDSLSLAVFVPLPLGTTAKKKRIPLLCFPFFLCYFLNDYAFQFASLQSKQSGLEFCSVLQTNLEHVRVSVYAPPPLSLPEMLVRCVVLQCACPVFPSPVQPSPGPNAALFLKPSLMPPFSRALTFIDPFGGTAVYAAVTSFHSANLHHRERVCVCV